MSENETYKVLLSNRGNPDHRQNPNRPVYGTPKDEWRECVSLDECTATCREYIGQWDLGGGNFTGGVVIQEGGNVIKGRAVLGIISYNGRFWPVSHEYGKPNAIQVRAIKKLNTARAAIPPFSRVGVSRTFGCAKEITIE